MRRSLSYFALLVILIPAISNFQCTGPDSGTKPNIIFIMSDDHTSQAFGVYGSRLAALDPTPTIDRIAKEGILFENCFCTNSICTPSRASIITGQYPQTNGVLDLDGNIPPEKQFLPAEMKKLGYETAMIGKWHLKQEPAAFDYYCVLPGQGDYYDPEFRVQGENDWPGNLIQTKGHSSDMITDISLDWLKNKRNKDMPFFLMHHFKAPHDMFEFAPRYADYLEDTEIPEPASMYYNANNGSVATRGENDELMRDIGSSIGHRNIIRNMGMHMEIDPEIPDPEYTHLAYQEYLKRYLRCVKGVDDNVKRLFDYLEEAGLMDNTIIIYTGDQGFMLGEHDYIDKRWMYEESHRMPFLVRYPGMIESGSRTDAIINNTYFAPTILELAGGTVPDYMQGKSFKPILESGIEPEGWPQATYYRYWMHMAHRHANPSHFGVRTKDYKLIFYYGMFYKDTGEKANLEGWGNRYTFRTPPGWEFYDLEKDPFEMDNRYGDPAYAQVISDLKEQLKELRKDLKEEDDKYPLIQGIIETNWD
ncbi:sulfatase [Bacteroidota bacterium]